MPGYIALFIPELRAGGAQRVMLTLAKAFLSRGIKVDIVLARKEGAFLADVPAGAGVIDLQARFMGRGGIGLAVSVVPALVRYLRSSRPDAMLSTLTGANLVAVLARLLARVQCRLVLREAVTLQNLRNILYRVLMKKLYRRADAVVSLTPYMKSELVQVLGLPDGLVVHIPNPIDVQLIHDGAAEPCPHAWLEPGMPPVFIAAGRLIEQKDFATLIRAFALLVKQADARLVILGEGPEREQLERLAAETHLQERVLMPGFESNPYRWMARARAYVLASRWEGQPNSLMEAMSLGIPVVCTDYDASIREIVGTAGQVVNVADARSMAAALIRVLQEPVKEPATVDVGQSASIDGYESLLLNKSMPGV